MAHPAHADAEPAPNGRPALARCIVEHGRPLYRAAERFQGSHTTARRRAHRFHTAIDDGPPASRVTDLSGQNS